MKNRALPQSTGEIFSYPRASHCEVRMCGCERGCRRGDARFLFELVINECLNPVATSIRGTLRQRSSSLGAVFCGVQQQ